ncbi:hypothetical protein FKW77_005261 [Venturia effusa]|uniref:Uncharacterized protein n=1 Tax=Venturia effusa TaxID=50376 RepID=A0A517L7D9_9PEZI|nr:hypothetical protein FKW77_005261 [Venturia effusa]
MSSPGKQSPMQAPPLPSSHGQHTETQSAQCLQLHTNKPASRPQAQDIITSPQLHPLQTQAQMVGKGILRGSPKRKRRDSQEENGRAFEPQLSQELEKAKAFAEINSHLKGERFSPKVLVTPKVGGLDKSKTQSLDTRLSDLLDTSLPARSDVGETARRAGLEEVEEGANSPRTNVAKKLGKLELHERTLGDVPVLRFGGQAEQKERKKIRLEGFEDVSSSLTSAHTHGEAGVGAGSSPRRPGGTSWHHSLSFREKPDDERVMEIPETPQPPAPSSHRRSPPPPMLSPSRTQPPTTILPAIAFSQPRSSTSPPPSNEMANLTWQDSEITGHLASDPDDDGYGVNGIGFRPTPAMAYARSQRRRQQIMEWKNRESREARSRRAEERRRGMKIGGGGAESEKGRAVRFLD